MSRCSVPLVSVVAYGFPAMAEPIAVGQLFVGGTHGCMGGTSAQNADTRQSLRSLTD